MAHMEGLEPSNTTELRKAAMFAANTFGIDQALEHPSNGRVKTKSKTNGKAPVRAKSKSKPVKAKTNKSLAANDREETDEASKPTNQPLTVTFKLNNSFNTGSNMSSSFLMG